MTKTKKESLDKSYAGIYHPPELTPRESFLMTDEGQALHDALNERIDELKRELQKHYYCQVADCEYGGLYPDIQELKDEIIDAEVRYNQILTPLVEEHIKVAGKSLDEIK